MSSDRKYHLVAPAADWQQQFEAEAKVVRGIFGDDALELHHIGSTSIPGIHAKPCIDIFLGVTDPVIVERYIIPIEEAGYSYRGDKWSLGLRTFSRIKDGHKVVNVHADRASSSNAKSFLLLRDYLRLHPDRAREYERVKLDLCKKFPSDYESYVMAKKVFLDALMVEAEAFFS